MKALRYFKFNFHNLIKNLENALIKPEDDLDEVKIFFKAHFQLLNFFLFSDRKKYITNNTVIEPNKLTIIYKRIENEKIHQFKYDS